MKKLLRCLLVVTMLLSVSLSSVMALGSISKPGTITNWDAEDADKEAYELVWNEPKVEDVVRIPASERVPMGEVNRGEVSIKDHLKDVGLDDDLPKNTQSVILIQEIRDLLYRNQETKEYKFIDDVTVTWEVPTLVEGMGDVYIYHYSDATGKYELIKPISVDYVNKTVTVFFGENGLGPVGVLIVKSSKKPVNTNAVDLGMMLSIISAGAGALYILTNKKEA